jgi:biotin transport system substrate-specific component
MNATVADLLRPYEKTQAKLYDAFLIVGGSLTIGLCAQIAFWLPFSPVPVTGQTFAVLLLAALLGARRGSLSVIAYILEATAGLPFFALGRSGVAVLLGPTGGYLVGFIAASYIIGRLAERRWDRQIWTTLLAMVCGSIVIYICGLIRLSYFVGFSRHLLIQGLYPFIFGDIAKILLATVLLPSAWKILKYSGFLDEKNG